MIGHRPGFVMLLAAPTAALLLLSCASTTAVPSPASAPEAAPVGDAERETAALSFIAYTGESITGTDAEVARQLAPCFVAELAKQPLVESWELVWGPMVYRFDQALYNDNLMYVVRRRDDPSALAVVIRGTNAPAALDWLVEDFSVFDLHPWPYGDPPAGLEPKISHGTRTGLEILQEMVPPAGVPGAGQGLAAFLRATVADPAYRHLTVTVTGHSLGGALSPALALWLADTRSAWDPHGKADLEVYAYAGPTAGDVDFATWYGQRLGDSTHRVYNALGVPPLAWVAGELRRAPDIYLPVARFDEAERLALDALILAVEDKHYQHVLPDALPMAYRALNRDLDEFERQVEWQHHCAYLCGLGIRDTFAPVSADCKSAPPDPCPVCP